MNESSGKLKPGDVVWCRIETPEPGGYSVSMVPEAIKGFLPSTEPIDLGRVVPTTLVCFDGERALFTFAFTMGTSERVQHSKDSMQENAFSVWADAYPKSFTLRRAVDIVMPPLDSPPMMIKLDEKKTKELFPTLEETNYTGCMKIFCQSSFSRAAMIILHGRVVGCVYTKKPVPDPYPFEIGLRKLMEDITSADVDADLEMYELPIPIVLAMSSLFQGYPDHPTKDEQNLIYAERMLSHFSGCKQTACLNLLDRGTESPTALGFVCRGEFQGTYAIGDRLFSQGKDLLFDLIAQNPALAMQAHILPAAMTTDAVRFGYSLKSKAFV